MSDKHVHDGEWCAVCVKHGEDEARAEPPPDVGAAHTIVDGEVVWCALLEAQEAARSEPRGEGLEGYWERAYWDVVPKLQAALAATPLAPALDVERIEALEYPETVTSGESSTSPSWYHGHSDGWHDAIEAVLALAPERQETP